VTQRTLLPRLLLLASVAAWASSGSSQAPPDSQGPPTKAPALTSEPPAVPPGFDPEAKDEPTPLPEAEVPVQEETEPAPAPPPLTSASPGDGILGWIAGTPMTVADLLGEWQDVAGRDLVLLVDRLVATRLAFAEADRLGIRLAPEVVEARLARERERLAQELGVAERGLSLEEFVRDELGREPGAYFAGLRRATLRQMIAERAVRAWVLSNPNAAVRLIVVPSQDEAEAILTRLENGADFAGIAREESVDDTAGEGGYVAYLVNQERSPLARLAFATEVGAIAGPLPASGRYVVLRVEEKRVAQEGPWSTLGTTIEASLAAHPVKDSEFVHWKIAMERRYPIDLEALENVLARGE